MVKRLNTELGVKVGKLIIFLVCTCFAKEKETRAVRYADKIITISNSIEALKSKYPQLDSFSTHANSDTTRLKIVYNYHTHPAKKSGGWTSKVPTPDSNGVWLYIGFHKRGSSAQIHTQPFHRPLYIGDLVISFLILEGSHTRSLQNIIYKILEDNGAYTKPILKN